MLLCVVASGNHNHNTGSYNNELEIYMKISTETQLMGTHCI